MKGKQQAAYRNTEQNVKKILTCLAERKEYAQRDFPKVLGKNYRTALRYIQRLEKEGYIRLARTECSEKGGKDKKIYTLTAKGFIHYFFLTPRPWTHLEKVIENFPDMFLVFKKWSLFKKAGLGPKMLETLRQAIETNVVSFKMVFMRVPMSERDVEMMRTQVTKVVLLGNLFDKDVVLARVCKQDAELRSLTEQQLENDIDALAKDLKTMQAWQSWWSSIS